jgi:hypothetical protein
MKFRNTEEFTSQELELSYGQNLYMATVSYTLETVGEYATWEYPAECETEIANVEIITVEKFDENQGAWFFIEPSQEVKDQIFEEIKKYHKL